MAKMFLIGNIKDAEQLALVRFLVEFLLKLNMHLPYIQPSTLIPRVFFKRNETYVHTKTCVQMLAALFIIAKNWKQPNCPQNGILFSNKREQTTDAQPYG